MIIKCVKLHPTKILFAGGREWRQTSDWGVAPWLPNAPKLPLNYLQLESESFIHSCTFPNFTQYISAFAKKYNKYVRVVWVILEVSHKSNRLIVRLPKTGLGEFRKFVLRLGGKTAGLATGGGVCEASVPGLRTDYLAIDWLGLHSTTWRRGHLPRKDGATKQLIRDRPPTRTCLPSREARIR